MSVDQKYQVDLKKRPTISPTFFDLNIKTELESFQKLVRKNPSLEVFNEIDSQLIELMQIKNPCSTLSKSEAISLAKEYVGYSNFMTYGKWVHYPWLNALVHILPQEEFIQVRTSRNNYKISPEEQTKLSTKKIGVIGLSVGQSIAITMAIERIFGEIRIADFDELELTNMNRIRAGVHQLGVPKVALVAREIAEIDPYLNVKCFWEGVTEETIDEFLLDKGKIDLVADECDSIDIKFLIRERCKNLEIPVIMDTSDRGMLDIERYDLEPTRSPFHGLIEHLDLSKIKDLKTTEEKVEYTLPIIGLEKASPRIKASMMEIGTSITTWPQLSSDVALGGAISTNAIRRILLNQLRSSGRYFVDTNEIISDVIPENKTDSNEKKPPLSLEEMETLADKIRLINHRIQPSIHDENKILKSALSAPSGGNCQPWKWLIKENAYFLFHDEHYSKSFLDIHHLSSFMALGCSTENFMLTANGLGYEVELTELPLGSDSPLAAVFQFKSLNSIPNLTDSHNLEEYIFQRCTNRNEASNESISISDLKYLKSVSEEVTGANLSLITDKEQIKEIAFLLSETDKIRMLHQQSHKEMMNEIRFSQKENQEKRDGIDLELLNLTSLEELGLKVLSDDKVIHHLREWSKGDSLGEMSEKSALNSSAIGLVTMEKGTPLDYFNGGRAAEKAWLAATRLNLAFQPLSALPYFLRRLDLGGEGFSEKDKIRLKTLQSKFNQIFNCTSSQGIVFLFRLAKAEKPAKLSLRKNQNELIYKK